MPEYKGVLICAELENHSLSSTSRELLGIGRKLADELGEELGALILGNQLGDIGKQAIAFGADKAYLVDNPLLAEHHTDAYTAVVANLCQQLAPSILLLGQTDVGRDLAPRLAARLGSGLSMDCLELTIDAKTKSLLQTRPVYGANAYALMAQRGARPQIVTVRPKSMPALEPDPSRKGEVIPMEAGIDASVMKSKVVQRVKEETSGVKLEEAQVVVAGGRGVGGKEGFALLTELARLLGGALGATRPPCEEGWVSTSLQIGQTGKTISPNLYIAVAISGAMQHIASCLGSKHIVAINKDPGATIFQVANYGIEVDYKQVLPTFIAKVKELQGK